MLAIEAHKTQALWVEVELNLSSWTITMLSDDELPYTS